MAKVLVVGGAGYVGSATCAWLVDSGHDVWVLDDLSTGHRELLLGKGFTLGRCGDVELLADLVSREKFDCAMHFAGKCLVGESVLKPQEYFENNVTQTRKMLDALMASGVRNFIFSSSCAIFGDPGEAKINESFPKKPLSPYGQNKLDVEKALETLARDQGLRSICLRYFNAAGAEPKLRVGEWHRHETHLIPRVLTAAARNQPVEIFGTDYPTQDGTCVRDYVHVWDLAAAHGLAMERLLKSGKDTKGVFEAYNLGSEKGYSVREVIRACEEVTRKKIQVIEKERRPGDPPRLVADSELAKKVLGFAGGPGSPTGGSSGLGLAGWLSSFGNGKKRSDLKTILSSAWDWEKKRGKFLRRAVFLDRDGTINHDPGYLSDPSQLALIPKAGEALSVLKKSGYLLVIVSNQSGVARGLIDEKALPLIHRRLDELLVPFDVKIDRYELCLHHPDQACECRKPKPKLILDAATSLEVDLSRSYMIGDKGTDLAAGYAAGCKASILVRTGDGANTAAKLKRGQAAFIADSLLQAASWILTQEIEGF